MAKTESISLDERAKLDAVGRQGVDATAARAKASQEEHRKAKFVKEGAGAPVEEGETVIRVESRDEDEGAYIGINPERALTREPRDFGEMKYGKRESSVSKR